jgi:hypothetical protein
MTRITCTLTAGFVLLLAAPVQAQTQTPYLEGVSLDLASANPSAASTDTTAAARRTPSRATLWGATLAGGGLAAGAVTSATYLGVRAAARRCDDQRASVDNWTSCSNTGAFAFIGMSVLANPVAIAGGVTLGGHLAGGQGRYDMTLLGSALGSGLGWAFLMGMDATDNDAAFMVGLAAVPLLQLAGSMFAYHVSHGRRSGRERQFGPTLTPMRQGAVAGLAGRF